MFNPSPTRKSFWSLFDTLMKWTPTSGGRTRKYDSNGNTETNLSKEIEKLPVSVQSLVKDNQDQYLKELKINIDFEKMSPMHKGSLLKNGKTSVEEELEIIIKAYFEQKYDEWRDSP